MKTIIDRATSRGYFNHGWLKTYHTFSFANYYNPRRIQAQFENLGELVKNTIFVA